MHTCCLGVNLYLLGNIVWELFREAKGTMANGKAACATVLNIVHTKARELGMDSPTNDLTPTMNRASMKDRPRLKVKAAEGRCLLVVIAHMLETYYDITTEHNKIRLQCVKALCRVYNELNDWVADSPLRLGKFAREHIALYNELRCRSGDDIYYQFYPKHHLWIHVFGM